MKLEFFCDANSKDFIILVRFVLMQWSSVTSTLTDRWTRLL